MWVRCAQRAIRLAPRSPRQFPGVFLACVCVSGLCLLYYAYGAWLYHVLHGELPCFEGSQKLDRLRYMLSDVIPWDQDGDIGFLYDDLGRVKFNVIPKLKKRYNITMDHYNPVIMRFNGTFIDVFAIGTYPQLKLEIPVGVSITTLTRATYRLSTAMEVGYVDVEPAWILPTHRCAFGNSTLACPAQVSQVLHKRYPHTFWLPFGFPFKLQCYTHPWNLLRIYQLTKS